MARVEGSSAVGRSKGMGAIMWHAFCADGRCRLILHDLHPYGSACLSYAVAVASMNHSPPA
jgi:hypothetical protein